MFIYLETVFLCNPGCPGTYSIDQAGLELRDQPASASQELGLKVCAAMSGFLSILAQAIRAWNCPEGLSVDPSLKMSEGLKGK